jgi:4-aminobutyrate aminotransferase-like enzyme
VLDVIEGEGLQQRAHEVGRMLLDGFGELQARHDAIGHVRGEGMYLGIDLVVDRTMRAPATALAADVANALRDRGVLVSTDGPADNVLKIKPPIVFDRGDAEVLLAELDAALARLG